jgi:hypothetical protein
MEPACEALPGRQSAGCAAPVGSRLVFGSSRFANERLGARQLIGLINGVMTGVTAGAIIGFIGAIAFIAGFRFAAFFLAGFFFLAAFLAGFFFAAFFFDFLATRFFDARFLDDFFFAFLAFLVDFFFAAFFFAAMVCPFNVDRLLTCGAPDRMSLRTTKRSDSHRTSW